VFSADALRRQVCPERGVGPKLRKRRLQPDCHPVGRSNPKGLSRSFTSLFDLDTVRWVQNGQFSGQIPSGITSKYSFFNKLHYEIIQTKNKGEVITEETKKKVDYQGRLFIVGVRPPFDDSVASYETGIKYYAQGKIEKARECLSEALNKGLKGFARTASILILTVTDRKAFLKFFDKKKKISSKII